jgi:diaminopimelate decarboxylase
VPKILIEPGRFITSRAEFLLAKVLTVKNKADGTRFAITNAGRLSITFPLDFEYHEVFVAGRPSATLQTSYQVMGRICTSADWMFKNRLLPDLIPGDILAVMDAGAYFSSYSTDFAFPRPPITLVSEGKAEWIRQGETFEHLTAMDRV